MLNYEKKKNVVVVYVDLPLDIRNSPLLQKDLNILMDQFPGDNFVLNMNRVNFMNSAGLGVLILSTKKLESGNRCLKITNLSEPIKKIVQLLEADEIIDIYETEEDAVRSIESSS